VKVFRLLVVVGLVIASVTSGSPAAARVTLAAGTIAVPTSGTFLYVNSEAGDSIGLGAERLFTSADSDLVGWLTPEYQGRWFRGSVVRGEYSTWWFVDFTAPPGLALSEGSYVDVVAVQRSLSYSSDRPGLLISSEGRACSEVTGDFDVDELSFWPNGELRIFQATFEQHCEGQVPALHGRFRLETPEPLPPLNLSIAINGVGTLDAHDSVPTASGRVFCARSASVTLGGYLTQELANRNSAGTYLTTVSCVAPSTPWSATVWTYVGQFVAGPTQATADAMSCDVYFRLYTCAYGLHRASAMSEVKLNAGNGGTK
jgi:hypothetical protein